MDLQTIRHSAAHIMAQAVKELYPETKLAIGPAINTGFYYDFDRKEPFIPEELVKIEERMGKIVASNLEFKHTELSKKEAVKLFKKLKENYKLELIDEIEGDSVSIYQQGKFIDLCRGPHLDSTGQVKAFKLLTIAGAYWKGSESNAMLQRIYGTAFGTKEELEKYLSGLEEAKKRDHRKLGRELDLFSFHNEGPGFPFFHPKGVILYQTLLDFWRKEHKNRGYVEVKTPLVLREELWKQSGHFEHYKEHMYFTSIEDNNFAIRPMNCPGGVLLYKEKQHSYRELPIKMAELGLVHRHELSGVLHGLFRVKAFVIDDAHIFCMPSQICSEIVDASKLILHLYKTVGFNDYGIELSTRPQHSMGSDKIWEQATNALKDALTELKIDYKINQGEGAFYGPKIDFHIRDCLGRMWQCGTIQIDFSMPERFDLGYIGEDGKRHQPVMIHRAAFGSVERFIGILIEHYGGAFPVWLAPEQVRIMTIADRHIEYARKVACRIEENSIRVESDFRNEKIGYKIREAQNQKIPYMIIIGEKEIKEKKISLRSWKEGDQGSQDLDGFILKINEEIKNKKRG